jgi:hypothetical protein
MAEPTCPEPQFETDIESTGLPALSTWPAVYVFVLGAFVGWIILLSILSRAFS